jgi:hypothetical protein
MMNRGILAIAVVAFALMSGLHAYAGNKTKVTGPVNESNYNFRCVGPTLDLNLSSFTLPFSRSAGNVTTGASSGAGRLTSSSITIDFPASKAYATLYSQVARGDHYSSCTLVETVNVPASPGVSASTVVFTWIFSQVTPTSITAIWKDGSESGGASTPGAGLPLSQVRATFSFSEVRFEDGSGSSTTGAVDSWQATQ